MHDALEAAGRDPSALQVQGTLPVVRTGATLDLGATMAGVAGLVEVGVTDFRFHHRWAGDPVADEELLGSVTAAFREAVGRGS